MLTGAQLELLTAAVDGELDANQQRQVERLLAGSGEARALFLRLRQDAAAVRSLPARGCPVDLSGPVVEAVRRQPRPAGRPVVVPAAPPAPAGVPAWFAFAIAASVLFLVGVASFLYFDATRRLTTPTDDPVAPNLVQIHPPPIPPREKGPIVPTPERGPTDPPKHPPGAVTVERPKDPEPERPGPTPEPPVGPIFTGPSGERIELRTVEPTAPTIHKVQGLEKPAFLAELGKASAFRLELPSKDAGKVVERLLHVAKGQNLTTTLDAVAKARLDKPQWKSSYFLVLEDVTPDELTALLEALADADRKGEPKKPNEPTVTVLPGRMVLSRLNKTDQRDLADHLGVELAPLPPAKANGPLGVDLTRPLADQTAEEVERRLSAGKTPRPAILLAYGMPRQVAPSADVQKYLASRKPARPGTLQVMLVLRQVG